MGSKPTDSSETAMEHYKLPDAKMLETATSLEVLDEDGQKVAFATIIQSQNDRQRQLIIFVRHFFCGYCENYVRALSKDLPPKKLSSISPPTTLTIIGCGQPANVADYKKRTDCPFTIYCDPDRKLYEKLGMLSNLELGDKKPEYMKSNTMSSTLRSIGNIIGSGRKGMTGGAYSQNGGEWLFEGGELQWCRRMRNTQDHAEIVELKKVLRIED